ncbi:VirB4 family type IV secretion system protein [Ralstonia pseudosolanacearum]|uniref:VirB4 family type IV secretion system protein n=1 Tax=Ralstonia pseudosolanacearum TaxID=1310165 RepID=UPI003AAAB0F2
MLNNPTLSPFDRESLSQIEARLAGSRRSTAELVPWLFKYNDFTIANKDSALMVSYEFTAPDSNSISLTMMRELYEHTVVSLSNLSRYPITLWWTVHRRLDSRYVTLPMPDKVAQMVDDDRHETFLAEGNYVNRHYLTFSLLPQVGLDAFASRVMHGVTRDALPIPKALWEALRATFSDQYQFAYTRSELEAAVESFETMLHGYAADNPHIKMRRLAGKRLGAFMHAVCSPPSDHIAEQEIPDTPALDQAMCDTDVLPGHDYLHFYSNGRQRYGIATGVPSRRDYWPKNVSPKTLDDLLKIKGELTISHCFRVASSGMAKRFIDSIRKYHEGQRFDVRQLLASTLRGTDIDANPKRQNNTRVKAAEEANVRAGKVEMAEETYGFYNFTVMSYSPVYEETPTTNGFEAEQAYKKAVATHNAVEDVLRAAQFMPVRETLHALSAFATTIPGMWRECARWAFLDTEALSRLLPLRGVSRGAMFNAHLSKQMRTRIPALAAFTTEYGTPFWFTAYLMDLGHMLICGRSGFGKTIFMLLCATLFRKYPNARLIGFDMNLSMRIPTVLQGGRYLQFAADADLVAEEERATCNPYVLLGHQRHFKFLVDWTVLLASQRGYRPSTDDRKAIEKAIRAAATRDPQLWRLRLVHASLPNGPLKNELDQWVGDAVDATYFDNQQDGFDDTQWTSIATDKILGDHAVARPFLSYATYRIKDEIEQRRLRGIIAPTVVMLPEIWSLLDDAQFAKQIGEWIVTMRKLLGCVWMDAQTPEQVSNSPIWPAIRDNVLIRVFVPVKDFKPETKKAYEEKFGLTQTQQEAIKKLKAKRDYFITEDGGISRSVSVPLPPRTVAILRSELQAQILFDRHMRSGAPDWKERYIEEATEQIEADNRNSDDEDHHA